MNIAHTREQYTMDCVQETSLPKAKLGCTETMAGQIQLRRTRDTEHMFHKDQKSMLEMIVMEEGAIHHF
jgi:hypothetical protein